MMSGTLSLTSPLTRSALDGLKRALAQKYDPEADRYDAAERHAAVLVPLCNVNNKPGILLEVRGQLRTHSGECRCGQLHSRQCTMQIRGPQLPRWQSRRCTCLIRYDLFFMRSDDMYHIHRTTPPYRMPPSERQTRKSGYILTR